jgi:hypothetical protein
MIFNHNGNHVNMDFDDFAGKRKRIKEKTKITDFNFGLFM